MNVTKYTIHRPNAKGSKIVLSVSIPKPSQSDYLCHFSLLMCLYYLKLSKPTFATCHLSTRA